MVSYGLTLKVSLKTYIFDRNKQLNRKGKEPQREPVENQDLLHLELQNYCMYSKVWAEKRCCRMKTLNNAPVHQCISSPLLLS